MPQQVTTPKIRSHYLGVDANLSSSLVLFIKREKRLPEYERLLSSPKPMGAVFTGLTGKYQGHSVLVLATGVGPGQIGDAVLAVNLCDSIALYSGTCGGLSEELAIGDFVCPTWAVCGDGFSMFHGCNPFETVASDPTVALGVRNWLRSSHLPCKAGTTFTTCTVVSEAEPNFWDHVTAQCLAIEMGAAAFFAACQTTGMRGAAMFWVTDLPLHGASFFDALTTEQTEVKENRYGIMPRLELDTLVSLAPLRTEL
ncbi:MAG: hypothetical protein KDB14_34525 [Planctomycetales bacterium]|nr:hypothetical protein [Planctomycetales bacterium]MCA9212423.1 hypothetical protein [Planctomycetales bacterium]